MKISILLSIILVFSQSLFSQIYKGKEAERYASGADLVRFKEHSSIPAHIRFKKGYNMSHEKALDYTKKFIKASDSDLILKNVQESKNNSSTYRYYQTLNGYPIEFSSWNVHVKENVVTALNGEIFNLPDASVAFTISEEEALIAALSYINAEIYMWQDEKSENMLKQFKKDETATYYPKGEKVIAPNKIKFKDSEFKSAYKFNIYSLKPYDRKMVYVDAQTGDILFDLKLIHNSNEIGTAHTQYSGVQEINTEYDGTHYILKDNTRGQGIRTFDFSDSNDGAEEFTDSDNNWNNVNANLDEYATDAHFATMKTYDYYINVHNRNSIDGAGHELWSFIHYNLIDDGFSNNVNAFWSGECMFYGDGDVDYGITPLTTVDICGHEITHGLTQYTADLIYYYESGALNEAFSDIFSAAVEYYATPEFADWTVGEDIGMTMRSLANPEEFDQPDTYLGNNWIYSDFDNGGVHINCGVLNYWFYLATVGGSGVNDNGDYYNVNGIGIQKTEQIAFKLLVEYLTGSSEFNDAYYYGMQAALDIYGECSEEVETIGNAFFAVGLAPYPYSPETQVNFSASGTSNCAYPFEVEFYYEGTPTSAFLWEFGDGNISNQMNPIHTYTEAGYYDVRLTVENNCGTSAEVSELKEDFIAIDESLPCVTIMEEYGNATVIGCSGIVYDPGGQTNNYPDNVNSTLTIYSPEALRIVLDILELDIELSGGYCDYDYIAFYDGTSSNAPLINNTRYCNDTGNPGIISSTGNAITIRFHSDISVNNNGFAILYSCIYENAPIADFIADNTTTCDGLINFTDISTNSPTSWEWDFGDESTSNEQNPVHQYKQNGTYTVKLRIASSAGSDSLEKTDYITVNMPEMLPLRSITGCYDSEFNITIPRENTIYWYSNIEDTTPIYIGNRWHHSAIPEDMTYYVREAFIPENPNEDTCISNYTTVNITASRCQSSVKSNDYENISIAPNPNNGKFKIFGIDNIKDYNISVTDISGKTILNKKDNNIIDLGNYAEGVYFIRISNNKGQKIIKFIIQK